MRCRTDAGIGQVLGWSGDQRREEGVLVVTREGSGATSLTDGADVG